MNYLGIIGSRDMVVMEDFRFVIFRLKYYWLEVDLSNHQISYFVRWKYRQISFFSIWRTWCSRSRRSSSYIMGSRCSRSRNPFFKFGNIFKGRTHGIFDIRWSVIPLNSIILNSFKKFKNELLTALCNLLNLSPTVLAEWERWMAAWRACARNVDARVGGGVLKERNILAILKNNSQSGTYLQFSSWRHSIRTGTFTQTMVRHRTGTSSHHWF